MRGDNKLGGAKMGLEIERVTYVDDDPDIREVARIALEMIGGLTLDLCMSGGEAIQKTPDFAPDVVLLDVMMPDMDGIETFKRLRALPAIRDCPIIFMTAKAQPREVEQYFAMGAAGVITKPFDPVTLPDDIRAIWSRASAPPQLGTS